MDATSIDLKDELWTSAPIGFYAPDHREFLKLQNNIVRRLRYLDSKRLDQRERITAIQSVRESLGKWFNTISHHPEYDEGKCAKITCKYNKILRDNGYDSEYECNDEVSSYGDISTDETVASDSDVGKQELTDNSKTQDCRDTAFKKSKLSNNNEEMSRINTRACSPANDIVNNLYGDDPAMDIDSSTNIDPNKTNVPNQNSFSDSIPLQNKFSPLANLPTAESTQEQANNVNQGKPPKISPITLKKPANYRELLRKINEVEKIKCIAKETGEFLKLHCTTPDDAKKLTDYFDKNQNEYFVTPRRTNKPIKVVIKGLPKETDTEEIKEELTNKNFRVEKVNQLKKFKTREPLNIFQIHLTLTDNVSEIYKLDTLCYHFISVEVYRSRIHYQCFNCQRWNHGSNGCKLNPRCVVCSENHPSKECPLKGQKSNTPKCANCNGPHAASYRGCPRYPQNIQKNKLQPGKSYANALKSNYENVNKPPPQKTNENDSEISQPPSTVKNNENFPPTNTPINHSEISDIMAIVAEFRKIFRNVKNIRATVQQLQATEGAFEKIAILAEALR
ncbi:Nucleic-acid-binding protein from transposon X-element [Araneus ventricosus]|uniref:Nucleic-acid-binding protein from transposon X-element n=1 Tax=Araneus ventricosus TaxID=182803 RepID=A0A4Y2V2Y3_ARAVE|nr:Nucleic-acid-binding protein from transposon X-element [Araneus ventricosus]